MVGTMHADYSHPPILRILISALHRQRLVIAKVLRPRLHGLVIDDTAGVYVSQRFLVSRSRSPSWSIRADVMPACPMQMVIRH